MSPYQKEIYKDILSRNWEQLRSLVPERKVSGSSGRGDGHKLNNILMQLRKCLNHPYTIEGLEPRYKDENQTHLRLIEASGKLVLLHQMLPKLKERGHRVLIFSTMRLALDVLEDYIIKEGYKYVRLVSICFRTGKSTIASDAICITVSDTMYVIFNRI